MENFPCPLHVTIHGLHWRKTFKNSQLLFWNPVWKPPRVVLDVALNKIVCSVSPWWQSIIMGFSGNVSNVFYIIQVFWGRGGRWSEICWHYPLSGFPTANVNSIAEVSSILTRDFRMGSVTYPCDSHVCRTNMINFSFPWKIRSNSKIGFRSILGCNPFQSDSLDVLRVPWD